MQQQHRICLECREIIWAGPGYHLVQTQQGWTLRTAPPGTRAYHQTCAAAIARRRNQKAPTQAAFKWA